MRSGWVITRTNLIIWENILITIPLATVIFLYFWKRLIKAQHHEF
jgi:hypothetical protein